MKRTLYDHFKDFRLNTIRVLVRIWMFFDFKIKRNYHDGFKPNRKEPYILLANHTFMFDVIHVQLPLRNIPYTIASRVLFVRQPTKYLLGTLAHAIPKSKGKADINTAKQIMKAIKKGYPVLIYPEGDTTFYGETNYIEDSTFKLIKKLNVDVVCVNQKGGYLSRPRWATGKRKNRRAQFDYHITMKKEELQDLTVHEVGDRIKKALYHNDYEYQRTAMIKHPGKQLAEGFENGVYLCPNCDSINSIETSGNQITCTSCSTKGAINEYGFIEGFKFDNLVDWDKYQRGFIKQLRASTIV